MGPLVYCAHHPQGLEWRFRKLANPSQNTEVAEEWVERMREGGKQKKNSRILGDKFLAFAKAILATTKSCLINIITEHATNFHLNLNG